MFYLCADKYKAHVLIVYRAIPVRVLSHIGLGCNALHSAKVLRKHRIRCDIMGAEQPHHIAERLRQCPSVTHCIIEAPWVSTNKLIELLVEFPDVHFVMRIHSNVAFLTVEAGAIIMIREQLHLQESCLNFSVAGNSIRLIEFVHRAYRQKVLYLPNLFYMDRIHQKNCEAHDHKRLRVGSFGALRIMKNQLSACAAALLIAESRDNILMMHVNINREEHGKGVINSMHALFRDIKWATLHEVPWAANSKFRQTIATMDLCIAPSMSESFCLTAADAAAELVPTVASTAIDWLPDHFKADLDDVADIARVGNNLLSNKHSGQEAFDSLAKFQKEAVEVWLKYLDSQPW